MPPKIRAKIPAKASSKPLSKTTAEATPQDSSSALSEANTESGVSVEPPATPSVVTNESPVPSLPASVTASNAKITPSKPRVKKNLASKNKTKLNDLNKEVPLEDVTTSVVSSVDSDPRAEMMFKVSQAIQRNEGSIGNNDSVVIKEDKKKPVKLVDKQTKEKLAVEPSPTSAKLVGKKNIRPKENHPSKATLPATGYCLECLKDGNYDPDSPIYKYATAFEDAKRMRKVAAVFDGLLAERSPQLEHMVQQMETLKLQLEKLASVRIAEVEERYGQYLMN